MKLFISILKTNFKNLSNLLELLMYLIKIDKTADNDEKIKNFLFFYIKIKLSDQIYEPLILIK